MQMKITAAIAVLMAANATVVLAANESQVLVPAQVQIAAPVEQAEPTQPMALAPAAIAPSPIRKVTLPVNTMVQITPAVEITSKEMKEGTTREFLTVADVVQDGVVIIPRGSSVTAQVTWRTGKGIVGKSAKFELSFDSVRANGQSYPLRGVHRQEGRGNTAGALLGSMIITGRSAVMQPGQIVNAFTKEAITITAS